MAALKSNFEHTKPDSQAAFLKSLKPWLAFKLQLSLWWLHPSVAGKPHVFLANFADCMAE
jgi:hypothetical protein